LSNAERYAVDRAMHARNVEDCANGEDDCNPSLLPGADKMLSTNSGSSGPGKGN
jgi:hypothetical protein